MIIRLPWIREIDTLNLPNDFEELVKESFKGFTKGTATQYKFVDKLLYLDNVRKFYTRTDNSEAAVDALIMSEVRCCLEEGEMPDAEDILSLEFMEQCYNAGFRPFKDEYERYSSRDNEETLKAILKIIQIVVDYED